MSTQLSREDLAGMSPESIVSAKQEGRLDVILGRAQSAAQALEVIERKAETNA